MAKPSTSPSQKQCERERDLYWRLLELGSHDDLAKVIAEALALIVEVTQAQKGYLAVYGSGGDAASPRFSIARGCSERELEHIREHISRGIIAQAIATGQTVLTPSASNDPRFRDFPSVQAHAIGS